MILDVLFFHGGELASGLFTRTRNSDPNPNPIELPKDVLGWCAVSSLCLERI